MIGNQLQLDTQTTDSLDTILTQNSWTQELQLALMEIERAKTHSALLSRISMNLSSSLEYDINLSRIVQLVVPLLGDWCFLELFDTRGELQRVQVAHANPSSQDLAAQLKLKDTQLGDQGLRSEALFSGKPVISSDLAVQDTFPEFSPEIAVRSAMAVPLVIRGKVLGVLVFLISESDREFNHSDLRIAEEIAYRSAVSIENSTLYQNAKAAIASRDEFLSVISHELKTPLTSLSLLNELLLQSLKNGNLEFLKSEKTASLLQYSFQNIHYLNHMLDDLFDVSAIHSGRLSYRPEIVNVTRLIQDTVQRCMMDLQSSGCILTMELADPCFGFLDSQRIAQVLTNLISNAVKYAPGKPVVLSLRECGPHLEITIKDSGPGISKEDQDRIFQRFERGASTTEKVKGLGLGLYIVDQIVCAHKGSIEVKSAPSLGATFTLKLPREESA